jgi:hypothetical protein
LVVVGLYLCLCCHCGLAAKGNFGIGGCPCLLAADLRCCGSEVAGRSLDGWILTAGAWSMSSWFAESLWASAMTRLFCGGALLIGHFFEKLIKLLDVGQGYLVQRLYRTPARSPLIV